MDNINCTLLLNIEHIKCKVILLNGCIHTYVHMYPVTVHVHLNDPTCSVFQLSFLALSTAPFECTDILYKHTHTLRMLQSHGPHIIQQGMRSMHLKVIPSLVGLDAIVISKLHCKVVILWPITNHGLAPLAIIGTGHQQHKGGHACG